jgi:predicted Zn finger-like uncharacterized protein
MSREWRSPPGAGPTMRITCPNCAAQYEVDEGLIPDSGRDVQCSNCGKGWFQAKHPEDAAEPEDTTLAVDETDEATADAGEPTRAEPQTMAEAVAEDETEDFEDEVEAGLEDEAESLAVSDEEDAAPQPVAPAEPDTDDEALDDDIDEAPAPVAAAFHPKSPDEAVLAVLREEAEREIAQRRQEAVSIESQPDLGLAEPVERRTGPAPADIAAGAAVAGAARRDLLPDIDEINSTLRSDADRTAQSDDVDDVEGERRRGFRLGFGLMILVAAALIGLYVGAAALAQAVPALEPVLAAYVAMANGLRSWLDGLLAAGVNGLSG